MTFGVKISKTDQSFQPDFAQVIETTGGYDRGYDDGDAVGYGRGISEMEAYNAAILKECNAALLTCGVAPVEGLEAVPQRVRRIIDVAFMAVAMGGEKFYLDVSPGTPVKGIAVDENGKRAQYNGAALPENWNVKMDLNQGGMPTLTLRNVNATEITGYPGRIGLPGNTMPVRMVLIGENSLASYAPLSANGCDIIISGTGSLDINNVGSAIGSGCETVTIQSGAITTTSYWNTIDAKSLVIEGGTLRVVSTRYDSNGNGIKAESIVIKDGAVEVSVPHAKAMTVAPDLSQYNGNYRAVGGTSNSNCSAYNEDSATTYKYFRITGGV